MSNSGSIVHIIFIFSYVHEVHKVHWLRVDTIEVWFFSVSIFRRTLLGYYAEGMHANFKEN